MELKRVAAKCRICGKTLMPEEVEVGIPLECPRCAPKTKKTGRGQQKETGDTDSG